MKLGPIKSIRQIFFCLCIFPMILTSLSCTKKGEEDPKFSLRTRKARFAGDWKVTLARYDYYYSRGFANDPFSFQIGYEVNGVFDIMKYHTFTGDTTIEVQDSYRWEFTFEKNGEFKSTVQFGSTQGSYSGNWSFNSDETEVNFVYKEKNLTALSDPLKAMIEIKSYEILGLANDRISLTFYDSQFGSASMTLEPR